MTHQPPVRESLLELYDALAQHQLRDAGAEVAAAIAHAVGTPLNVISGRAELIRHDPSNALAQVARIEEQVKKMATGLRQLVDYLAVPDPRAPQRSAPASKRTPAEAPVARSATSSLAAKAETAPASDVALVAAGSVLDDVVALTETLARASNVEVVADGSGLASARVERWHALGTLGTLVSSAIRHCASRQASSTGASATNGHGGAARIGIGGAVASQGVVFELLVPGLGLVEGWQLEHFQARPAPTESSEFYRTVSICGAVVRGHGGKLLIERAPNAEAVIVRFSCANEAS